MTIGDTSRVALRYVEEAEWGVTPALPMRGLRAKSQSLDFALRYVTSEEFRDDRQVSDIAQVDAGASGQLAVELSWGAADDLLAGALFGAWSGVAVAGAAVDGPDTFALPSGGTAFVAGHLVQGQGFAAAANRAVLRVTGADATAVTVSAATLAVEDAGAGKRLVAVGFEGTAGDLAATADGLASGELDFTTLGLAPGQWIAIGGVAAGTRFATAAANGWARIAAIAPDALALDHRPTGWAADAGAGKTIRVFFGERLRNGTVERSFSIERDHTDIGQVFLFRGQMARRLDLSLETGRIVEARFDVIGRDALRGAATFGTGQPIAPPVAPVMNAVGHLVLVREGGGGAGIVRRVGIEIDNGLRELKAVGALGNVGIGVGTAQVAGSLEAYFADGALYDKYLAAADTSLAFVLAEGTTAYVVTLPRVKLTEGRVEAGSRDSDCILRFALTGARDPLTGATVQIDRLAVTQA